MVHKVRNFLILLERDVEAPCPLYTKPLHLHHDIYVIN